jgi:hypothetical protein
MPVPAGEVAAVVAGCEGWLAGAVVVEVVATAGAGVEAGAAGLVTVADITFVVTLGAPAELGVDPAAVVEVGAVVLTGAAAEAASWFVAAPEAAVFVG